MNKSLESERRERSEVRFWGEFRHAVNDVLSMTRHDVASMADYYAGELAQLRVDTVDVTVGYQLFIEFLNPHVKRQKLKIALVEKINLFNFDFYKKRLVCKRWWKAQLMRHVSQYYEAWAIGLGKVGAAAGAWYCSDRALDWRAEQQREAEAMMKAAVIESESGERVTLWDAARSTVANKAHRRDELMTRIRGCEEWAQDNGMLSMFTTNTAPSRFHAQRKSGGKNPKYDGSNPAQAQAWLCETWARCRAQLHREGVTVYGFRVAEPHHDGCPHWHMLLWCKPEHYDKAAAAMRGHWLREPEQGSATNRLKIVKIDQAKGTAAGYIAKYIAKNIDDFAISHHMDDAIDGEHGTDAVIEKEDNPAQRVDAWASTWRIRQFQAIGQPSVTVWRELRRTSKEAAAGGSDALITAWLAVHRRGDKLACWNSYMKAQGGAMRRRDAYRLGVYAIDKTTRGRYGEAVQAWACGIDDRGRMEGAVTPTKRQSWGGEGFSAFKGEAPWTRLNNCTRSRAANRKNLTPTLDDWRENKAPDTENKAPDTENWEIDPEKARQVDEFWSSQVFTM